MNDTPAATPTTVRPTKKQRQLLDFIETFIAQQGYSPSYREIMNGLQYNSVATVALHVSNLIKRGHLRKRDHSARSLEVVRNAAASGVAGGEGKVHHEDWLVQRVEKRIQQLVDAPEKAGLLLMALEELGLPERAERIRANLSGVSESPQTAEKAV